MPIGESLSFSTKLAAPFTTLKDQVKSAVTKKVSNDELSDFIAEEERKREELQQKQKEQSLEKNNDSNKLSNVVEESLEDLHERDTVSTTSTSSATNSPKIGFWKRSRKHYSNKTPTNNDNNNNGRYFNSEFDAVLKLKNKMKESTQKMYSAANDLVLEAEYLRRRSEKLMTMRGSGGEQHMEQQQQLPNSNNNRIIKPYPKRVAKVITSNIRKQMESTIRNSRVIEDSWETRYNNLYGLFEKKELRLGLLVGSGCFSDVFEICGFSSPSSRDLLSNIYERTWNEEQQLDRDYIKGTIMNEKNGKFNYALKQIKSDAMESIESFTDAACHLLLEAQYLSSLQHDNILKLRGWSSSGINSYLDGKHDSYFLILDRLECTLDIKLQKWKTEAFIRDFNGMSNKKQSKSTKKNGDLQMRIKVAYQVALALKYIHSKNMVFRDLKPTNIGFDNSGVVKIFDFGLARELPDTLCHSCDQFVVGGGEEEKYRMTGMVGTIRYMAPEVALMKCYNQKVDTYSWAMILWSCLSLTEPHADMNRRGYITTVCNLGHRPILEKSWSSKIRNLLDNSWSQDPSTRFTMLDVCDYLEQKIIK